MQEKNKDLSREQNIYFVWASVVLAISGIFLMVSNTSNSIWNPEMWFGACVLVFSAMSFIITFREATK